VTGAHLDTELLLHFFGQLRGAQVVVFFLARVEVFAYPGVDLVSVPVAPIDYCLPPAASIFIFRLLPGQLLFVQLEAQFLVELVQRLTASEAQQQLLQALRLFQHGFGVIHCLLPCTVF
jgi:hypothetical protein